MVERSDQDGQPEEVGFNWARRRDRGTDELIGLCRGVLADGVVVIEEAKFMHDWLVRNEPVRRTLAGRELYETLCKVLVHGQMDPEGESALVDLLLRITGGNPGGTSNSNYSTTLPLDNPPPEIVIPGKAFCFTGKFEFGTRTDCQSSVVVRGGTIHTSPTSETGYLVIGLLGSRDWAHSNSGRKIERAVELRESGHGIRIVAEAHWAKCLPLAQERPAGEPAGPRMKSYPLNTAVDQPLAGQTVWVTGTLEKFSRQEIESTIAELGGRVSSSVSKKTSFVLAGADPGSKLDKARTLKVAILSEEEFLTRIGRK